jgi:hypothetical protein
MKRGSDKILGFWLEYSIILGGIFTSRFACKATTKLCHRIFSSNEFYCWSDDSNEYISWIQKAIPEKAQML